MTGEAPKERPNEQVSVLVVDDDTMFLELMAELLGEAGYRATTANSASATADFFDAGTQVDVLLCDIDLRSNGNGVTIAQNAREVRPDLPIVFISGHSTHLATSVMADLTNVHFLQKPFRWEQLSAMLISVLASDR